MRSMLHLGIVLAASLLCACVGGNGTKAAASSPPPPPPVLNTLALTVDGGPAAAPGAINHGYVTVKICEHGSTSKCANIDHVLVDTGSWGLRLVGSVLATNMVALTNETDASNRIIEECVTFGGGQTWGPVARADVTLAAETASDLPVQVMDDTLAYAPPPSGCGANSSLINSVSGFNANGVLGVGVFAQDCGALCANAATPLPLYYGCTAGAAGVCTAEDVAVTAQVTNPVAMFAVDNNGVIVDLPNLQNPNGDVTVQGSLIFGLSTQSDNALPASGLTVLGTDANGDFRANFNGAAALPSWIDSGADDYEFNDPSIASCTDPTYVGYYCPVSAPLPLSAVNNGVGAYNASSAVQFSVANPPMTFVAGAAAFAGLAGGGGSGNFVWGMPYFYGQKIYIGLEQRTAGVYTGPYFAY
jgi:Protein of unknown function (DUF3443)